MDPVCGALGVPPLEVPIDGVPWREVVRQGPPRTPCPVHIQDRLHDPPARMLGRATAGLDRHHRFDQRPLLIDQVRGTGARGRRRRAVTIRSSVPAVTRKRITLSQHLLRRELPAGAVAFPDQTTAYRAVIGWAIRYYTRRRHPACANTLPRVY